MWSAKEWKLTFIPIGSNASSFFVRRFFYVSLAQMVKIDTFALRVECSGELRCAAADSPV